MSSRPSKGARLELTDPTGEQVASGSPYKNGRAALGRWRVNASAPGYEAGEESFEVVPDQPTLVEVALRALGGLVVDGEPRGAAVKVSGPGGFTHSGGLPWQAQKLAAGTYRVEVSRPGYAAESREAVVRPGEQARETERLELEAKASSTQRGSGDVEWVRIEGGTFRMGSTDGLDNERSAHDVELGTFEMARTETTVEQYGACVKAGACTASRPSETCDNWGKPGRERHPVNSMTWNQATAFCRWAGGRLPNEAEWEYAARGRGRGRAVTYSWGDEEATCERAVMDDGGWGCGTKTTWPVCSKERGNTPEGLCDMAGNVWEWVSDWYDEGYHASSPRRSPSGPSSGSYRVVRGGGFFYGASGLRASYYRYYDLPGGAGVYLGLRCARSSP